LTDEDVVSSVEYQELLLREEPPVNLEGGDQLVSRLASGLTAVVGQTEGLRLLDDVGAQSFMGFFGHGMAHSESNFCSSITKGLGSKTKSINLYLGRYNECILISQFIDPS